MLRLVALLTAAAATGCFYTDSINDRPATELYRVSDLPLRGGTVIIEADSLDPNGDPVTVFWTATVCGAGGQVCDTRSFADGFIAPGVEPKFTFTVPTTPDVRSVKVVARTEDVYGAPALLDAELVVDVGNRLPVIPPLLYQELPPNLPTLVTGGASDEDDDYRALAFSWDVIGVPPGGNIDAPFVLDSEREIAATATKEQTYRLTPDAVGDWTIEVVVTDPLGAFDSRQVVIPIGADQPPCLGDVFPLPPPTGVTLPVDELRRFSVLVVTDDLDVFPAPPPNDPYRGEATFRWFLASPATGGTLSELTGAVGNAVEIDPAAYAPGDRLDLRVEIADREPRTLPCAPTSPTCSLGGNTCLQRQSWAVEVR